MNLAKHQITITFLARISIILSQAPDGYNTDEGTVTWNPENGSVHYRGSRGQENIGWDGEFSKDVQNALLALDTSITDLGQQERKFPKYGKASIDIEAICGISVILNKLPELVDRDNMTWKNGDSIITYNTDGVLNLSKVKLTYLQSLALEGLSSCVDMSIEEHV